MLATNPRQRKWQSGVWAGTGRLLEWKPVWPCPDVPEAGVSGTPTQTLARTGKLNVMDASNAISRLRYRERPLCIVVWMQPLPVGFQRIPPSPAPTGNS